MASISSPVDPDVDPDVAPDERHVPSQDSGQPVPLHSDRGTTTIGEPVVTKIVGTVAREVKGVHATGTGVRQSLAELGLGDERTRGVAVEVGEREVAVDVEAVVDYGADFGDVTRQIRDAVTRRVQELTGLTVVEVNVTVSDVHRPGDDAAQRQRTDRDPNQQPEAVRRLQRRRRAYQEHGVIYRTLWVVAGATVVLAGVVMIAFPGPAFLIIPLGLAMLSFEFAWAQRLLDTGISTGQRAARRVERTSGRTKALAAAAIALALLALLALLIVVL